MVTTGRRLSDELIQILMKYPDRRIKPIVLVMMLVRDPWLEPGITLDGNTLFQYEQDGIIVGQKIIVYAGEPESYYSFITREAYDACLAWMNFRKSYNEEITGDSYVMRDMWQTTTKTKSRGICWSSSISQAIEKQRALKV